MRSAEFDRLLKRARNAAMPPTPAGVLPPHAITRVSEYVPEVIAMIQDIMDRGFAYAAGGSVYFDVPAFSATSTSGHAYGKLVPENVGNSAALEEGEGRLSQSSGLKDKRDSSDFALWKASKEGEPAWPSPWGPGRPGWHIECSAMATAVLKDLTGGSMDIHSGGVDLRFPHHDNELAQAEAALGIGQWVNYFVHSGHLNIDGLKMSKSLKNFIKIGEALKKFSARSLRLLFLMHKYNAPMDYSGESMEQVEALDRLFSSFFDNVKVQLRALQGGAAGLGAASQHYGPRELAALSGLAAAQADLHAALCDDFDTPTAMRVLQRVVRDTNKYMSEGTSVPTVLHNAAAFVTRTFKLFGLIAPQRPIGHVATGASTSKEELLTPYLDALATFRSTVREAAKAKDTGAILAACDALRDEVLPPLGVQLEDAGATSAAAAAAGGSGGASGAAVAAPAIWKLGDPAELLKERDAKQAAAAAKAAAKAAEKERLAKEQAEKARVAAMTPAQFMASLTVPDGTDPMYTQFGEDGLPTADAAGEPLTKAGAKKAAKLFKNHQKAHAKWLKAQAS